jgi:RNA polymerase sigma-70 factor (ECF subfamily)
MLERLNKPDFVADLKANSTQAWNDLYKIIATEVRSYIESYFPGLSPIEADEIAAQTIHKVRKELENYDPSRGSFKSFVFNIAISLAKNYLAWRKRRPRQIPYDDMESVKKQHGEDIRWHPEYGAVELSQNASYEEEEPVSWEKEIIREALEELNDDDRDLLLSSQVEERKTIARDMGLPEGTVRSRLSRAMKKLHNKVEEKKLAKETLE